MYEGLKETITKIKIIIIRNDNMDLNNLTCTERMIINTILTAGIVFLSSLTITGLPTIENVWAAFVGAGLALLTQLLAILNKPPNRPPQFGSLI